MSPTPYLDFSNFNSRLEDHIEVAAKKEFGRVATIHVCVSRVLNPERLVLIEVPWVESMLQCPYEVDFDGEITFGEVSACE